MYMHTRTYVHASLFVNVLYTSLYVIMYMNVCVYTHSCVRSERYVLVVSHSSCTHLHCSSMKKSSSADNLLLEGLYASPKGSIPAAEQQAPPLPPPPTYDAPRTRVSLTACT